MSSALSHSSSYFRQEGSPELDPHIRKQVNRDILRLEEDPRPHGVEKLETKEKLYRVYVGPGKN